MSCHFCGGESEALAGGACGKCLAEFQGSEPS